jgi:hypothetical protein
MQNMSNEDFGALLSSKPRGGASGAIPKTSLFTQIKPNLNHMTTLLTIFTFTHAIKCTTKYYSITKFKKNYI